MCLFRARSGGAARGARARRSATTRAGGGACTTAPISSRSARTFVLDVEGILGIPSSSSRTLCMRAKTIAAARAVFALLAQPVALRNQSPVSVLAYDSRSEQMHQYDVSEAHSCLRWGPDEDDADELATVLRTEIKEHVFGQPIHTLASEVAASIEGGRQAALGIALHGPTGTGKSYTSDVIQGLLLGASKDNFACSPPGCTPISGRDFNVTLQSNADPEALTAKLRQKISNAQVRPDSIGFVKNTPTENPFLATNDTHALLLLGACSMPLGEVSALSCCRRGCSPHSA